MRQQINFQSLSALALKRAKFLVSEMLPLGKSIGNEWVAHNPRRNDASLGSFKVNIQTGRWADFATGDKGGDLISLIAYLDNTSQLSAARKLSQILGIKI